MDEPVTIFASTVAPSLHFEASSWRRLMKLIPVLALTLLIPACSDRAEVERQEAPKTEPAAPPAPEAEKERTPPAPAPVAGRKAEPIEDKEARAAADGPVRQEAARAGVNADAAVLQDFKARVDQ